MPLMLVTFQFQGDFHKLFKIIPLENLNSKKNEDPISHVQKNNAKIYNNKRMYLHELHSITIVPKFPHL